MRDRERVLQSLENVYRSAFDEAKARDDRDAMVHLDLQFQRDQLQLEVLMDIRELLTRADHPEKRKEKEPSLLERAQTLRRLTKLR